VIVRQREGEAKERKKKERERKKRKKREDTYYSGFFTISSREKDIDFY